MLDIQKFLEKYIARDEQVIVACSAGPDSMFLLYHLIQSNYKKNIIVCHFNHKTRSECEREEKFLVKLCKQENIDIEIAECDFEKIKQLYPSKSFEELAREKRYQFFNAVSHMYKAQYVLTAHHLDDRIETMMFHMLRGTKLSGLINMTERSGNILRPLLNIEKLEILKHLDTNNLKYFIDSTNFEANATRNKLRLNIIPEFETIHPEYKKNLSHLLSYFEDIKRHLDQEVQSFLNMQPLALEKSKDSGKSGDVEENTFCMSDFFKLSELLQKEVIRHIYFISNNNSTIGLSESNIAEIIRFIGGKNNKTIKEIRGLKMEKYNGVIKYFTK